MTSSDFLLRELSEEGVLRLTLNDVQRRNALSEAMLGALGTAFEEAGKDPAVSVIILAANGPAFCASHGLKEMTTGRAGDDGSKAYFAKIMVMCSGVMQGIVNCPKPVIAEVTGIATAAGCQLVASCDLAIAAQSAQFSTPGVHIGLFCSNPMVALSRNAANKYPMEMLLTGDMISAARACEIGLVNRALAEDTLQEARGKRQEARGNRRGCT
ncbi:putative enoyl-CoA hydratase echA8 [Ascidiaceihabitans donghaensis]|uniref:Putative enoyl-CoA hydratase echA8 n=1 Tax=Ascidiaceihabitans donghaensis TaxID=1510460 RepID=A0A2R8BC66_9RHOB|nr:putative enoyl-CoA hydratase echA8 [Ascidiaceihabitans donghaensis]